MRFSLSKLSLWSFADISARWVHPSVDPKSEAFSDHARFIGSQLIMGCLTLTALPLYLAYKGSISGQEVGLLAALSLPAFWAYLVAKTGRLKTGVYGSLLSFSILIMAVCLISGGLNSPFLPLLCIIPIEAAMARGRSGVKLGALIALLSVGLITLAPALGSQLVLGMNPTTISAIIAVVYSLALSFRFGNYRTISGNKLREEKERFRLLADNATDLITRHDKNGLTLFASPAARPLFGAPASSLLNSGLFEKIHLQDRIIFLKSISAAIYEGCEQTSQFRVRCKGQEENIWKWVEMRSRPTRDDKTNRVDVVSVTRDITTTKEQSIALQDASTKSEEANLAQRRFLATMSHELRTPLNAILGFSDVLKQELFGALPNEQQKEYVGLIHDSGTHLLNVVNDLLDISRIEAGKYELVVEPFDVIDIADATVKMLQPMAAKGEINVQCDVLPTMPVISADKRSCQQILINLVSNAIKFTPKGGHVRLSAKQHGRSLKLRVKDNGIGIDEVFLRTIGQPFMQAETGHDRGYDGSGLGLSVVKGLVALHDGELDIQSTKGKGTTVTVTLPLKTKVARPIPADEAAELVHLNKPATAEAVVKSKSSITSRKGDSRARLSA